MRDGAGAMMSREWPSIAEVAAGLAVRAETLCAELLPAGRRHGREWLVGGVEGEPGRSLHITLAGDRAGRWKDFSSVRAGGDLIDLIAATRRLDLVEAWKWGIDWLGWGGRCRPGTAGHGASWPRPRVAIEAVAKPPDRSAAALGLFLAAKARIAGTPADFYLQARGIDLRALGRQPGALRCHPEMLNEGRYWPALVGLIQDPLTGRPIGLHRTFLGRAPDGAWRKAPVAAAKKVLGAMRGGWIPLQRGASGVALREAPGDDILAIAEGIEDALTIALAEPAWRVGAVVCAGNFVWTRWPTTVRRLRIVADNDRPGSPAAEAVSQAAAALAGSGREVVLLRPPAGAKDFNALLLRQCAA